MGRMISRSDVDRRVSVEILNPTEPLPNLTVQQLEYVAAVARSPTWADAAAASG